MEYRLKRIFEPEEIFVDIRETPVEVKDPYKGGIVPINDYVMLHSSTGYFGGENDITFLGLNRVFRETSINGAQSNPHERKSFWLRNSELFACMCSVVKNWLNESNKKIFPIAENQFMPRDWLNFMNIKVVTIDPIKNWYGFILNITENKSLFDGCKIGTLINETYEKGYSLMLIADNSIGNSGSFNIYIQISDGSRALGFNDFYFNFHALTLEKTNFKVEFQQKPEKLYRHFDNGNINFLELSEAMQINSLKFINAVTSFNDLFDLMSKNSLSPKEYISLVLDLYDRNRNFSSVELDDRLRNLINKTISQAIKARENEYSWKTLIKNIVENNAEDLYSLVKNNPNAIPNLFSKKMVIQKMERIYEAVLSSKSPERKMKEYIQKQVLSYDEIKPLLL